MPCALRIHCAHTALDPVNHHQNPQLSKVLKYLDESGFYLCLPPTHTWTLKGQAHQHRVRSRWGSEGRINLIGTLGLACLNNGSLPICKTVQNANTDAEGRFHYEMKGSDVKGSLGQVSLGSAGKGS